MSIKNYTSSTNKKVKSKLTCIFLVLLFGISLQNLYAQDYQIDISVPKVGENRFSVCGGQKEVTIRVENVTPSTASHPDGDTLSNIKANIDLSTLSAKGLKFKGLVSSNPAGSVSVFTNSASSPVFSLPDLIKRDDFVEFKILVEADCDAIPLATGTASPNFDVKLSYLKNLNPTSKSQTQNTGNFEVKKPTLNIVKIQGNSIPGVVKTGSTANIFDGIKGKADTLCVTVANGNDGPLNRFVFWVKDHPLLTLNKIIVRGKNGSAVQLNPITNPTPADGKLYFEIDAAAIAKAYRPDGSPDTNPSTFQFNELLDIKEIWTTDACAPNNEDVLHGVMYGCIDGNPIAKCEEASRTSGLRFGFVRPILTASASWGQLTTAEYNEGLPACYGSTNIKQRVFMVNTGTGDAVNIKFNLAAYRAELDRAILPNATVIRIGKYGAVQSYTVPKTYTIGLNGNCPTIGTRTYSADYVLTNTTLKPGDTLWVEFQMDYGCGCTKDGSYCSMENYYFGVFAWGDRNWSAPSTYEDACGLQKYDINQVNTTDGNSRLNQIVEGPATILGGQTNTNNYTATSVTNAWLQSWKATFPRGIYRMRYKLGNGVDWTGANGDLNTTELAWTDKNGKIWKPKRLTYTDTQGGNDYIEADYSFADFPAGFVFSEGMNIKFNYKGDCTETGPACSQGATPTICQTIYFSPDENCTDCGLGQLVSCSTNINVRLKCPSCGPCEGLNPVSFSLERQNYELPDNDNNNRPDASGIIDKSKVKKDRFISGDTLLARYKGVITTISPRTGFPNAYSVMNLPAGFPATLTPLGGKVTLIRGGTKYEANILQQFPEGQQLITDLSIAKLKSLGNTAFNALGNDFLSNDTVCIDVKLTASDPCFAEYNDYDVQKELLITDNSFASTKATWADAKTDIYTCNDIRGRAYMIRMKAYLSSSNGEYKGGCDEFHIGYDWTGFFIGSQSFDYFPYEYRSPKAFHTVAKYYKDPSLSYTKFRWHFYSKDFIGTPFPVGSVPVNSGSYNTLGSSSTSGSYWGELPMDSPYLTIIGDTLCFAVDKFLQDNFNKAPNFFTADEGYRFVGIPYVQGTCLTPKTAGSTIRWKPEYRFAMNETVFGYNKFTQGRYAVCPGKSNPNSSWDLAYGYAGGPKLILQVPIREQQALGAETCFLVELANLTDYQANLVWMTAKSPSGAVNILSVKEVVGATKTPLTADLGLYKMGAFAGGATSSKTYEICVSTNNCNRDSIVVNVGWECKAYPRTEQESKCAQPQVLYIKPIDYELGMVIKDPAAEVVADLCSEKEYTVQLASGKLGSLSNINLEFELPEGQEYIPGSFMYAYPTSGSNPAVQTYKPAADPTVKYGTTYTINVSKQDPTLASTGLPGVQEIGKNFMFVKFKTRTNCNYFSGASVNFLSYAYTACDELANYSTSPAAALKIKGMPEIYKTNIQLNAVTLNPCKGEKAQIEVNFGLLPSSIPTSNKDSIRIILPPGLRYVPGSYIAGVNAQNLPPLIVTKNGQQYLYWDLNNGLSGGSSVKFKFSVESFDAQQECRAYPIIAQTYSSQAAYCVSTMQTCNARALSSETRQNITYTKPDISVSNFTASSQGVPPNKEEVSYTFTVHNAGASIPAGVPTNIEVYADNGNGDYDPGIDQLLFTKTITDAIPGGADLTVSGKDLVTSGNTCILIAVINPGTTCACKLSRSFQARPALSMPFPREVRGCSNTNIPNLGPGSLVGISYEWFGINGAPNSALSSTTSSPITVKYRNTTTADVKLQYVVRIIRGTAPTSCYAFDTLTVVIPPELNEVNAFSVCNNSTFSLAGPTGGTNYAWTPSLNLTAPTQPITNVTGGISVATTYTLNYTGLNGCPAVFTANVGVTLCANTALGDTVWYDRNEDGIQNNNEFGIGGVTVYLYNASNPTTPIAVTTTNSKGAYLFDKIPFGNYRVGFLLPNGTVITKLNQGGDDTKDSDANPPATGSNIAITDPIFVPNGVTNLSVDAGIVFKDWGDAPNSYLTNAASAGPSHLWQPGLRIGALWDANVQGIPVATGQPARGDDNDNKDDEDGVSSFPTLNTLMGGQTYVVNVNVFDSLNLAPKLIGWIDFNGNGTFEASEGVQVNVPAGTNGNVPVSFMLPSTLKAGITYARFRLSTDPTLTTSTPAGKNLDGEVEDYELTINNLYDWGDAPDSYTTDAAGVPGPSHLIVTGLKIGSKIDDETNGQPAATGADATGDDTNGIDDEDGVASFPTVYNSYSSYSLSVNVQNITGKDAKLIGWIDWNGDGVFQANEASEVPVPNGTSGNVTVPFTIPLGAASGKTYARFRLTYDPVITKNTPGGAANSGEVEDYQFTILPCLKPDAGDAAIVCLPTTSIDLIDANTDQEWSALASNPASASIDLSTGSVTGMTAPGIYKFILRYKPAGYTCADTVAITINPKPNAGIDISICEPQSTLTLVGSSPDGVWTTFGSNPAGSIGIRSGQATGLTVNGEYKFVFLVNGCTDTTKVTRYLKPKAGADVVICNSQKTLSLSGTPANGTWAVLSEPTGALSQIDDSGAVTNLSKAGIYQFVYSLNGCTDTVKITSNPLPVFTLVETDPTCNNQGLPNNDGSVSIATGTVNNSYAFNTSGFATLPTTSTTATIISALPTILEQSIANSRANTVYYVRVFNEFDCYVDQITTTHQNICNQKYGSIGNYVWRDNNYDGKQTAGEPPVVNLKIYLLNAAGQKIDSTLTDQNGKYQFVKLISGTYRVQFVIPASEDVTDPNVSGAFPTDTLDSDAGVSGLSHPITIQVANAETDTLRNNPHIDLGLKPQLGSIGNYVWQDNNNDGIQDAGEPPIKGVKVYLLNAAGQKIDSTKTDEFGKYLFDSLPSGKYRVQFVPPAGTITSKKTKGTDETVDSNIDKNGLTDIIDLDVTKLKTDILRNNPTIDAGFVPVGSIGNYVWNDTNGDGKQGVDEPPVANVKVYLLDNNGQIIDSTSTKSDGSYLFDSLLVGQYKVKFAAPIGTEFTGQNAVSDTTKDSDANISSGTTDPIFIDPTQPVGSPKRDYRDADAGLKMQYGSIGNFVWSDLNNDGIQDASEPAIKGVKVILYKQVGINFVKADSMFTDSFGKYNFDSLLNGNYKVQFVTPTGFITAKKEATNAENDSNIDSKGWTAVIPIDVNRTPDQVLRNNPTIDAGFVPFGSIGNYVWADTDKDGLQDTDEKGVKNVWVVLYKKNTAGVLVKVDSVQTDSNGKYLFDSLLVGDYQVQFKAPAGTEFTESNIGSNNVDALDSDADYTTGRSPVVSIDPSKEIADILRNNPSIDAGLLVRYGSIGNYVWRDDNVDGQQAANEPPIEGVKVYLYQQDANNKFVKVDSTTTDANGKYLFDSLLSGQYQVQFAKPLGMMATKANTGQYYPADTLDSDIAKTGFTHNITIDVTKLVADTLRNNPHIDAGFVRVGSIGDYVWFDKNANGIQDTNEIGVTGIKVYLLDDKGNIIDSTTTDDMGKYLFSDLLPGIYQIKFSKPNGVDFSAADQGSTDDKDSDASNNPATLGLTPKVTIDVTQPVGSLARDNRTIDAGIKTPFGSIGNYVWRDDNNNGIQEIGELPIKGVTVQLLGLSGSVLATTTTDANGKYLFDSLTSGQYRVKFIAPAGMVSTVPNALGSYPIDTLDSDAGANGITHIINIDVTKFVSDTLRNNPQIDAGFTPVGSIGDFVWADTDKDGQQGPTENGVAGVTVYLWKQTASGYFVKIDSTTTDKYGKYLFDSLFKGDYKVQFVAPTGTEFTKTNSGDPNTDSDANFTTGETGNVSIDPLNFNIGDPKRDNRYVDAGLLIQYGSIGNYVWSDVNNDGKQTVGEPAIKDVKVILYKLDSKGNFVKVDSMLTDKDGKYLFDSLMTGDYKVQFIRPDGTIPAKRIDSTAINSDANALGFTNIIKIDVTKLAADTLRNNPQIDAGFVPVGSIGNYVWRDTNGDGKQDPTEKGVALVKVYLLDKNGKVIDSTITNDAGFYEFKNLLSGQYQVKFVAPVGADFTKQNAANDTLDSDVGLGGLSHIITIDATKPLGDTLRNNPNIDAGLLPQFGSIGNYVWFDTNRDGKQDIGEPAIEKVSVYLLNSAAQIIDSTLTNAQGKYLFDSLVSGRYSVRFMTPAGSILTKANATAVNDTLDSDAGIGGFSQSVVIDVDRPHGDINRDNPTLDAGFVPLGSIGDFVWNDTNADGKQTPGEKGIPDMKVYLYAKDATGKFVKIDSTFTDKNGKYLFDSLIAGDYQVQFVKKPGCDFTKPNVGSDSLDSDADFLTGRTGTITLDTSKPIGDPSRDNRSVDAGFLTQFGSIGDYVWRDDNVDGKQDPTEPAIVGVKVYLYQINTVNQLVKIDSTVTDSNGKYLFDSLGSGTYKVQFVKPLGMMATKGNAAVDTLDSDIDKMGLSHAIVIDASKLPSDTLRNNPHIDAGFVRVGSIGDFVWFDKNGDGVQNNNEPGLVGSKVYLLDNNGKIIDSTTTDVNGFYLFKDLLPGTYQIKFTEPKGLNLSPADMGGNDTKDSDADPVTGLSPKVVIDVTKPVGSVERDNRTIDAGAQTPFGSIGNYVWLDTNNNGIQETGESPIEGVTVYLLDKSGKILDSTKTNNKGGYLFDSLITGQYQIKFKVPTGTITAKPNVGGSAVADTLDSDINKTGLSHIVNIDVTKLMTDTLRNNPNIDAGFVPVGSIGDFVWNDTNKDGKQDPTEKGLANIKIYLFAKDATGKFVKVDSTTSGSNGEYLFKNLLAGDYQVQFVEKPGCDLTVGNAVGVSDSLDSDADPVTGRTATVTIDTSKPVGDPARDNRSVDAGYIVQYGSIGNYVWLDTNNDGIQDPTEKGIKGVKVYLLNASGIKIDSMLTDSTGKYLFDSLLTGKYQIKFVAPANTIVTKSNVGNDATDSDINKAGLSHIINLDSTKPATDTLRNNPNIDAGFVPVGSIGDFVWNDTNKDGKQDPTEKGIAGVKVYLISATGVRIDSTTTDSTGRYLFSNLFAGDYAVEFKKPANYLPSPVGASGVNETLNSDANTTTGRTRFVTILPSRPITDTLRINKSLDAGFYLDPNFGNDCVKPKAGPDVFVCKGESTFKLPTADTNQKWVSLNKNAAVSLIDSTTGQVTGMIKNTVYGYVLMNKKFGFICSDTVLILKGIASVTVPNKLSSCSDTTTLYPGKWQSVSTNPSVVSVTPQGKVSGLSELGRTYQFLFLSERNCVIDTIFVTRDDCRKLPDLALTKVVDKSQVKLNDEIIFTIKVKNEGKAVARGIAIADTLNAALSFVSSSADKGTYSNATFQWLIDSLTVGDSAILKIKTKVIKQGVWFNTAQVRAMSGKDIDSTPGNNDEGEDDISHACVSVPFEWCPSQKFEVKLPNYLKDVIWYQQTSTGKKIVGQGSIYLITEAGNYSYEASNCPKGGCCPITVVVGNCCPTNECIPYQITRKKKK